MWYYATFSARIAQSVEHSPVKTTVVGSSPTVSVKFEFYYNKFQIHLK